MQGFCELLRSILLEHPAILRLAGGLQCLIPRVFQNPADRFGDRVEQALRFENVFRDADARAEYFGLCETGFDQRMRSPFPSGSHETQIQQIIKAVEFGAAQNVYAEIIALRFATNEKYRHSERPQAPAQPMTPRAGQENAHTRFRLANSSHDLCKHVGALLPLWAVRPKREGRVGVEVANQIGVGRQAQPLPQRAQVRVIPGQLGEDLWIRAVRRQLRADAKS